MVDDLAAALAEATVMMDRDPDISLAGFSLWVTGQPYAHVEDAYGQDLWDFQTSIVTPCSTVRAAGVLSAAILSGFSRDLDAIHRTLNGDAVFEASEGGATLILTLAMEPLGRVEAVLDLRLGYEDDERHRFAWNLDQTFLEPFARQVRALSAARPSPFPASILEPDASRRTAEIRSDVPYSGCDLRKTPHLREPRSTDPFVSMLTPSGPW